MANRPAPPGRAGGSQVNNPANPGRFTDSAPECRCPEPGWSPRWCSRFAGRCPEPMRGRPDGRADEGSAAAWHRAGGTCGGPSCPHRAGHGDVGGTGRGEPARPDAGAAGRPRPRPGCYTARSRSSSRWRREPPVRRGVEFLPDQRRRRQDLDSRGTINSTVAGSGRPRPWGRRSGTHSQPRT